jgi:predicted nucleotidyltransferase
MTPEPGRLGSMMAFVTVPLSDERLTTVARVAEPMPGLRLLVLHGSRARGDAHALSDWDFAYEADGAFDPDALLAVLADTLEADEIDLVDLTRAGALLRHRVARDGVVLIEKPAGRFMDFRLDAVRTWCDLAPVLEPLYEQVLTDARAAR